MTNGREAVVHWLDLCMAKTGETATGLARMAGIASTTLTRFLADPEAHMLSLRTMTKIGHAAGVPPPFAPLAGQQGDDTAETPPQPSGFAAPEAARFEPADIDSNDRLGNIIAAALRGREATHPWWIRTRAVEGRGILPGDVVIVDLNATPSKDHVVCAQVYDWQTRQAETVWRVFEPPYLVAAALDPVLAERLRRPLIVDNDRVIIKGVVTDVLRAA